MYLALEVHEQLLFSAQPGRHDVITPGAVFTLEHGLYYADKGYGVRLKDVYYCTLEGDFECLTPFPKQLVSGVSSSRPYRKVGSASQYTHSFSP